MKDPAIVGLSFATVSACPAAALWPPALGAGARRGTDAGGMLRLGRGLTDDRGMFRRLFVIAVMASALAGCGREEAPLPPITPPLDVAAPPPDASVTASGLASKVLEPGDSNVRPTAASTVRVNYTGWTTAGEMFDSSIPRGEPVEFQVGGVIPGWTEGLQLMVVGEKRRFWIPADLAYGDSPANPNLPAGMLVFDIELLDVLDVQ